MIILTIRSNEGTGKIVLSFNGISDAVEFINDLLHHATNAFSIYIEKDVCNNDCKNCHMEKCLKGKEIF